MANGGRCDVAQPADGRPDDAARGGGRTHERPRSRSDPRPDRGDSVSGILTERDVLRAVATGGVEGTNVAAWMTRDPETVDVGESTRPGGRGDDPRRLPAPAGARRRQAGRDRLDPRPDARRRRRRKPAWRLARRCSSTAVDGLALGRDVHRRLARDGRGDRRGPAGRPRRRAARDRGREPRRRRLGARDRVRARRRACSASPTRSSSGATSSRTR